MNKYGKQEEKLEQILRLLKKEANKEAQKKSIDIQEEVD